MNSLYSVFEFPVSSFKYNLSKDFEKETQTLRYPARCIYLIRKAAFRQKLLSMRGLRYWKAAE